MPSPQNTVTAITQHVINSANDSSWSSLKTPHRLGPLDAFVAPLPPIVVCYVYEKQGNADPIPIERLKRALSLLLNYYPVLTGRLHLNQNDGRPEIVNIGKGSQLVESKCSKRLDEFTGLSERFSLLDLPDDGYALFAPYDPDPSVIGAGPVFTVQHTRFACGAVSLGIRLLHAVSDADGFFDMIKDLATLYRGLQLDGTGNPTLDVPPYANNPFLANIPEEEQKTALEFKPTLYTVDPLPAPAAPAETSAAPPPPPVMPPPNSGRFLHFSSAELKAIKANAADPKASEDSWVSSFDALAAHLHRVVYRARYKLRQQDSNQPPLATPDFLCPVNIRGRLGEDVLPPHYFGNVVITPYTGPVLSHEDLYDGPTWKVAKVLHDAFRSPATTSKEELLGTLKWASAQPDFRKIRQDFPFGSNGNLMVTQWDKKDMYGDAFFDSRPLLVQNPFTYFPVAPGVAIMIDGLAFTLPAKDDSIVITIHLSDPLWKIIYEDEEYNRFKNV